MDREDPAHWRGGGAGKGSSSVSAAQRVDAGTTGPQPQQQGLQQRSSHTPWLRHADLDALLASALHTQLAGAVCLPLQVRCPTPQDLLELSYRIYKPSRRLFSEADAQGLRVHRDQLLAGDVRLVMALPSWMPKPGVQFDWGRVQGSSIPVVLVVRGTVQDLVGNTRANLELLYNKLIDDQHLPELAQHATDTLQGWLLELYAAYPLARAGKTLQVHITGHSLGGFVAEVATVMTDELAALRGWPWRCVSFDAPGLPDHYVRCALQRAPQSHWQQRMTSYLAAPNPVNMLYKHLGSLVHVLVPFEQTWSHVAKCVATDAFRIAGWALVAAASLDGMKQVVRGGSGAAAVAAHAARPSILQAAENEAAAAGATAAAAAAGAVGAQVAQHVAQHTPAGGLLDLRVPAHRVLSQPSLAHPPSLGAAAAAGIAGAASAAAGGDAGAVRRAAAGGLQLGGLIGWLWGCAAGSAGVAECLAGILGVEVDELIAQHGLGAMRPCFDAHTGELQQRYRRDMASWPQLGGARHEVLLSAVETLARWMMPSFICPENVGFMSIAGRSAMVEARCSRLKGYVTADADANGDGSWDEGADDCLQGQQAQRAEQQQQHHDIVLFGGLDLMQAEHQELDQQQQQQQQQQHCKRARHEHDKASTSGHTHSTSWIVAEPPPEQRRLQQKGTTEAPKVVSAKSAGARLVAAVGHRMPFLAAAGVRQ